MALNVKSCKSYLKQEMSPLNLIYCLCLQISKKSKIVFTFFNHLISTKKLINVMFIFIFSHLEDKMLEMLLPHRRLQRKDNFLEMVLLTMKYDLSLGDFLEEHPGKKHHMSDKYLLLQYN